MKRLRKIMIAIEKTNIFIGKMMVGVTLAAVAVLTIIVLDFQWAAVFLVHPNDQLFISAR